jgi:putative toxin-antitoxin system antitoxin component (TIGR02293 family)
MPVLVEIPGIEDAHDTLGLTYRQIAAALKADESTLHRWRTGGNEPSPVFAARLEALEDLLRESRRAFRTDEAARAWLERSSPTLDGRRPMDLLLEGRVERVVGILLALNTGVTL